MKKLIFIFFLSLLAALPAMCQADRTFYRACHSQTISFYDVDQVNVRNQSDDSITIDLGTKSITGAKVPDDKYLLGGETPGEFAVYKVDEDSFFLISNLFYGPDSWGWNYYHTDKKRGAEKNENKRCAIDLIRQIIPALAAYRAGAKERAENENQERAAQANKERAEKENTAQAERLSRRQGILDNFLKTLRNRRTDPALEKGITAWWKEATNSTADPKLRFYMLTPNYDIVRNAFGEVLRKEIDVLMVNKGNDGKCEMSWRTFGYESLGGGTFDTALKNWVKRVPNSGELQGIALPGDAGFLDTGTYYPVACPAP